jgi:glucose-6-phosphate isomerase
MAPLEEPIQFNYQSALVPHSDEWTPLAELQSRHLLSPNRLKQFSAQMNMIRGQVSAERELQNPPPEMRPLDAAFIDLPAKLLENHRRKGDLSELGQIQRLATRFRQETDNVIVLGIGGSYLGARALFDALCHTYHNELPRKQRVDKPRIYFEGNNVDNDSLQDLFELLELSCVDPDLAAERWGSVVISKSGGTLETAAAYRFVRAEAAKFYGVNNPLRKQLVIPVTGDPKPPEVSKLRELCRADGYPAEDIVAIPEGVGGRYSVLSSVGLLPAAIMGLDIWELLRGALAMTRRFTDEPFERNPVLQYAAVNYLLNEELGKPLRVMAVWSKKLESLGMWYDQLLAESLGKQGRGPTPITSVCTRDLHSRGQQHQVGPRDRVITNVVIKEPIHEKLTLGMSERNEDDLNALNRKTYADLIAAAAKGTNEAYAAVARPTTEIMLPKLSEHCLGQLLQMLMLATVVEGRLMGVNPYGQPGVEAYKRNMMRALKG